jgi:LPXTG-site transpeptidase (sortase) family protein
VAGGTAPTAASSAAARVPSPVATAREGRPAESERIRFVPAEVVLPGRARAAVVPAATVDGVLKVPENVRQVGWWDGSAYAGDPFGSTVIAGHLDSATEGIGFFARLLTIKIGAVVTVRSGEHELSYRITSVQTVAKKALASDSQAFDQTGAHRLVLITCTGDFRPDDGGYESNLVVIGKPLGLAR